MLPPAVAAPQVRVPPAKTPDTGTPTLAMAPIWTKLFEPSGDQYNATRTFAADKGLKEFPLVP